MATLPPPTCCDLSFSTKDCLCGTFCTPCVYGSALARTTRASRTGVDRPESILPDTLAEVACCLLTCVFGGLTAPVTGAYIRASMNDDVLKPVCAELCCGLCCCLPCQMNKYRESDTAAPLL